MRYRMLKLNSCIYILSVLDFFGVTDQNTGIFVGINIRNPVPVPYLRVLYT